jgi:hypothetical protein
MKRILLSILICLLVTGCATYKGAGSQIWYDQRMAELEEAHRNQKISEAEYQNSKNQIDQIRVQYLHHDDSPIHTSVGFGWWH